MARLIVAAVIVLAFLAGQRLPAQQPASSADDAARTSSQSWQPPPDDQRCPSRWGAEDQRGSANLMGAETVLRATRLIRTGETFELGHVVSEGVTGGRRLEIYTKRTLMEPSSNRPGNTEELVVTEPAHIGTQIDGFAHQTIGNSSYNCYTLDEVATRTGFTELGIEHVGTLMTRGVLLDIAAVKGVEVLPETYEITVEDLQKALQRQGLALQRADAILLYTGQTGLRIRADPSAAQDQGQHWLDARSRRDPMINAFAVHQGALVDALAG